MKTAKVLPAKTFLRTLFSGRENNALTNEIVPSAEDKHYISIVVRSRVYCGMVAAELFLPGEKAREAGTGAKSSH